MIRKNNRSRASVRNQPVIEENVISYMNEYFEIFENNLKNGKFTDMNTRLPRVIVEKFKKLFELWDENRVLGGSMERKLFEDVHSSMCNTFGDNSDDARSVSSVKSFSLECKHCGEEFPLRNNDCKYSYEYHKISPEHLELTRWLNIENVSCSENVDKRSSKKNDEKKCTNILVRSSCENTKSIPSFLKTYSPLYDEVVKMAEPSRKCANNGSNALKQINATQKNGGASSSAVTNTSSTAVHIKNFDVSWLKVVGNVIRCAFCDTKLESIPSLISHMNGSSHDKTIKRYSLNSKYIEVTNNATLRCSLCNIQFARLGLFMEHCIRGDHQQKLDKSSKDGSKKVCFLENAILIDVTEFNFRCPIPVCHCTVIGIYELYGHFKTIHKLKVTQDSKFEDTKNKENTKNSCAKKQSTRIKKKANKVTQDSKFEDTKNKENTKNSCAKKQTTRIKKKANKNLAPIDFKAPYASVFELQSCLVFVEGSIRCVICYIKLLNPTDFVFHLGRISHRKVLSRLGVNAQYCMNYCNRFFCLVCVVGNQTIDLFLKHCKSPDHLMKIFHKHGQNDTEVFKNEQFQRNITLNDTLIRLCKCPVCKSNLTGVKGLYKHLCDMHPNISGLSC